MVSPLGDRVALSDTADRVRVWNLATGRLAFEVRGRASVWSRDGAHLLTMTNDAGSTIYDAGGTPVARLPQKGRVNDAAFSPDGTRVAVSGDDGAWRMWRVADGEAVCVGRGHIGRVVTVQWDDAGGRVVTAGEDRTARLWTAATCELEHTLVGHVARVNRAIFLGGGDRVLTAGHDGTLRVWDAQNGQLRLLLAGHTAAV